MVDNVLNKVYFEKKKTIELSRWKREPDLETLASNILELELQYQSIRGLQQSSLWGGKSPSREKGV